MEISFAKNPNDTGATPVVENPVVQTPAGDAIACPTTHVPNQTANGVPATRPAQSGLVLGDKLPSFSEIILPRINLVASVGGLKDTFEPGSFVYDQRVVLFVPPRIVGGRIEREGTPPVTVTVLGFRPTRYVENVKGGGRGLICSSEAEVRNAGGTTDYNEWVLKAKDGCRRFDYLAEALLAVERPAAVADDDVVFTFEADGIKYALALYSMKASAYTVAKRTVFSARSLGCLRGGYPTHSWSLSSVLSPTPDKTSTFWKPALVPCRKSTPAFLDFAQSVIAAPQVDSPEAE